MGRRPRQKPVTRALQLRIIRFVLYLTRRRRHDSNRDILRDIVLQIGGFALPGNISKIRKRLRTHARFKVSLEEPGAYLHCWERSQHTHAFPADVPLAKRRKLIGQLPEELVVRKLYYEYTALARSDYAFFQCSAHLEGLSPVQAEGGARVNDFPNRNIYRSYQHQHQQVYSRRWWHLFD